MVQQVNEQVPRWALETILEAKKKELKTLNLSTNFRKDQSQEKEKLREIPIVVFEMTWLEHLLLDGNEISSFPDAITRLSNLRVLDLSKNKFANIPPSICSLVNLRRLHLNDNELTKIPKCFASLSSLRWLELQNNKFSIFPSPLRKLKNIKLLNLENNRLKVLPKWLTELPKLTTLYLIGNPLESIPPHIRERDGFASINLETLRAFFDQLAEEGETRLYEAKLIVVGEPGAGKTSLSRKLINPDADLPKPEETTKGIDIDQWRFDLIQNQFKQNRNEVMSLGSSNKFLVNIWDFGGQAVYHATHQFFFTRRSVYVLVADAREQKTDFFYWLNLVELLSDGSPVILVVNEKQDRSWALNQQQLRKHFRGLREIHQVNLANNRGLEGVNQDLCHHVSKLPHVGDLLPKSWIQVRIALENNSNPTISLKEFLDLCQEHGIDSYKNKLQLSSYLHDLGVYLHFQDDLLLKHLIILKPEWGTDAVYHVLDNEKIKANSGHFSRSDINKIWSESKYSFYHDELLALMMKFQLCYELPEQPEHYIAPQLLGELPPLYDWDENSNLHLRYRYQDFMPKGILSRLIVRLHQYIKDGLVWRSGVILEKDKTKAEVTELTHRREIRIRISGTYKRDFLTIITYELDKLHAPFYGLQYDKLIPCICIECSGLPEPHFFEHMSLKRRITKGRFEVECDKSYIMVNVLSLIDDAGVQTQNHKLDEEITFSSLPGILNQLSETFNEDELIALCFELKVEYEDLSVKGRSNKARELILYMQRNGRLVELVELLRKKRPNFNW